MGPFEKLQLDYIQLPLANSYQYALLYQLTHWIEAFTCLNAIALETAGHLLKDIVPRFRVPTVLDMDYGTHFMPQVITHILQALGFTQNLNNPWHPSSSLVLEKGAKDPTGLAMPGDTPPLP